MTKAHLLGVYSLTGFLTVQKQIKQKDEQKMILPTTQTQTFTVNLLMSKSTLNSDQVPALV